MLNKILFKFGYVLEEKRQELVEAIKRMANERLVLEAQIVALKSREEKSNPIVDTSLGDPIPEDSEERRMYVAKVAGFFKETMEPKLKYMISTAHNMLESTSGDRDYDLVLKGVIYSFREMIKWGEAMLNEQLSNQTEPEEKITEDEIKTLTDKLN